MKEDLIPQSTQFDEIISIIDNAHARALKAVNAELINMYWEIGSYVSQKVKNGGWGKSIVVMKNKPCKCIIPKNKRIIKT